MAIKSKENSQLELVLRNLSNTIGIINLGLGNVTSVKNCLVNAGLIPVISNDIAELSQCHGYILPGVGTASALMNKFNRQERLMMFVKDIFKSGEKPMLTICLGMQILFEKSAEGNVDCLELIDGQVKQFNNNYCHIGWRNLDLSDVDIKMKASFYFNHSYYVSTTKKQNTSEIKINNKQACIAVKINNTLALQFHPEKSQKAGIELVRSFFETPYA